MRNEQLPKPRFHLWKKLREHRKLSLLVQSLHDAGKQIRKEEPGLISITHAGFMPGTYWRLMGEIAQCGFLSTRAEKIQVLS